MSTLVHHMRELFAATQAPPSAVSRTYIAFTSIVGVVFVVMMFALSFQMVNISGRMLRMEMRYDDIDQRMYSIEAKIDSALRTMLHVQRVAHETQEKK